MTKFNKYFCLIMLILSTLITGCSQESTRKAKRYPLHEAAAAGDCEQVANLLNRGFRVHGRDANKETAMHVAAKNGHYAVVKLLIEKNARISERGQKDQTPLHYACQRGDVNTVRLLLNNRARLGAISRGAKTPLHCAIENGHASCVELLLNYSTKVLNEQTYYWQQTPLHYACIKGQTAVAKLLLERNARKNVRDKSGHTPLYYAACYGHLDICKLLWQGSDLDAALHTVCGTPHGAPIKNIIEDLLSNGADMSSVDENLQTPLAIAAENGNLIAVRVLVSAGAELNTRNKNQQTPLHSAAHKGHAQVVAYLLQHDAETDLIDNKGMTPLSCALQTVQRNRQAINNFYTIQKQASMQLNPDGTPRVVVPHPIVRTIYYFVCYGVHINKDEQKWLDSNLPRYKRWVQATRKWLATVLEDTYVEALPQDLQRLLLEFIVSQTEPKRKRGADSADAGQSNKKQKN